VRARLCLVFGAVPERKCSIEVNDTVAIEFSASELGIAGLWRLARWCHAAGADEFTISVLGIGGSGEDVMALWLEAEATLRPYRRGDATRWVPSLCAWEEQPSAELWDLHRESILALERIGLDRLFAPPTETPCRGDGGQTGARASVHHLCLYRDGKPMLALFEEQGAWVYVVLRRAEMDAFRAQSFGPESDFREDYFPEYFP
jgi:hypothetical protein